MCRSTMFRAILYVTHVDCRFAWMVMAAAWIGNCKVCWTAIFCFCFLLFTWLAFLFEKFFVSALKAHFFDHYSRTRSTLLVLYAYRYPSHSWNAWFIFTPLYVCTWEFYCTCLFENVCTWYLNRYHSLTLVCYLGSHDVFVQFVSNQQFAVALTTKLNCQWPILCSIPAILSCQSQLS